MQGSYDVIVVGLGATGCASLHQLAKLGLKVLGIEKKNGIVHEGHSISPFSFYCRPECFQLLHRSIHLWQRLEDTSEKEFVNITGSLYCGEFYDELYENVECYGLDHEELRGFEILRRFRQLQVPKKEHLFYVDNGGVIDKRQAINALFQTALDLGAKTRFSEEVKHWEQDGNQIEVQTEKCVYTCGNLVLCCGHLLYTLIPELQNVFIRWPQTVFEYTLKPLFAERGWPQIPVFKYDVSTFHEITFFSSLKNNSNVHFYMKYPRELKLNANSLSNDEESVWNETALNLCPGVDSSSPLSILSYTNIDSIDGLFILDWHPHSPRVIMAFSGGDTGFHCSPAIAEVVSFMITDRQYATRILSPFSIWRDALRRYIPGPFYPILVEEGTLNG